MSHSLLCLNKERLQKLSEQAFSPVEMSELEEHVSSCEFCRDALQDAAAEPDWVEEVRDALATSELENDSPDDVYSEGPGLEEQGREERHALEPLLKLLGPTDDPRMLGRVGPYEIVGILGRGGMGVVFKGFDAALNRYVAIKMLLPHLAATGAARKRFAREAQAAAAVVDDHVMPIHGVSEWQGVPYLVMPYTRGVSLQQRLSQDGPLELREVLRIGMQTATALAAAHAQGLVHRDVKPANILLAAGVERVSLTDFGLARAIDDISLTRTGVLAGTPQYMSPEQARGQAVDARSDLFSLGSVLYATCTGRAPFRAESSYGVLRLITDVEPQAIRELNSDVPEWLCGIVGRLMAKQPAERFASAAEVAGLLEQCLAHVQSPNAAPLPAAVLPNPPVSPGRSRLTNPSLWKGVIAMVTLLATCVLGVVAWQATAPPDLAGTWSSAEWGTVEITPTKPGKYQGNYTQTHNQEPGAIRLAWSRLERRFNGAWNEGADCHGEVSLRLVDGEIRGSFTTDASSKLEPGRKPKLGDLRLTRLEQAGSAHAASVAETLRKFEGDWEVDLEHERAFVSRYEGIFSFHEGWFSHRKQGKFALSGTLEVNPAKSPPTFLMKYSDAGHIGGTFEFPQEKVLCLSTPNTDVRPRAEGKQPHRLLKLRRIDVAEAPAVDKALAFLSDYRQLAGLSLDMTEQQFKELDKSGFGYRAEIDDKGTSHYYIPTGDGHTVIVMFRNGKCSGIQRIRGEEGTPRPIDRDAEYERFEGAWRILERTTAGKKVEGEFGKDGVFEIQKRHMGDAAISLDPSKTPRQIDLTFTRGPDKGKVLRGIYEWEDAFKTGQPSNRLRICVSTNTEGGADHRPRDFKVSTDSHLDSAVWERVRQGPSPEPKAEAEPKPGQTPSETEQTPGKNSDQVESAPPVKPRVMSPLEVVAYAKRMRDAKQDEGREPLTVRFRVAAVGVETITGPDDKTYKQYVLGHDQEIGPEYRANFFVELPPDAEATFKRIGVKDVRSHFEGKTIEVQGQLSRRGLHLILSESYWFYSIEIRDLDQIRSVEPENETSAARGDEPGTKTKE